MIRRPLLPAAALCATLALTACNHSPEAGRPDTTPPSTPTSATPTASATPKYTAEEEAAIAAAKARYVAARTAVMVALRNPRKATRAALLQAGNGDPWLISILGEVKFQTDHGWHLTGDVKITPLSQAVKLDGERPQVDLVSCLDASTVSTKYEATGKPVPAGKNDGPRHKVQARLVYAPPTGKVAKMWFLIEEKRVAGKC